MPLQVEREILDNECANGAQLLGECAALLAKMLHLLLIVDRVRAPCRDLDANVSLGLLGACASVPMSWSCGDGRTRGHVICSSTCHPRKDIMIRPGRSIMDVSVKLAEGETLPPVIQWF